MPRVPVIVQMSNTECGPSCLAMVLGGLGRATRTGELRAHFAVGRDGTSARRIIEVARDYGVSRRWVITLVQRYLADGDAGLQPRSRRPLRSPTRTADELEDEIVAIRKDLDRHGHEAGAATIAAHLQRRHGASPAVSTIWRTLTARAPA